MPPEGEPVGFRPSDLPHHATDPGVEAFFRYALSHEFVRDLPEYRADTRRVGPVFGRHLREAFEYLLRERPCDVIDWSRLTRVAFEDEARLYDYLRGVFDHLFGDRPEPPVPPDPEAPPPDWVDLLWS
nr:hypothetical protein [Kitasatospora sp. SID7827]